MATLSLQNQLRMSNLELSSQLMQGTLGTISKTSDNNTGKIASLKVTNNKGSMVYATEGDSKYKEEIDSNDDGVITFNEYVKYVTENISGKYNFNGTPVTYNKETSENGSMKFTVTNLKKALISYMNSSVKFPTSLIEEQA